MTELIIVGVIGGVMALVGVVVEHLLQRMRNKDERESRREEIIYEKQVGAFEEAVRVLYLANAELVGVVEMWNKIWLWSKKISEGEVAERERWENQRTFASAKTNGDIQRLLGESRETIAKTEAYLPLVAGEAFGRYSTQAMGNVGWVTGLISGKGKEEDFKLAMNLLKNEYESAVAILREHMGIKERIQPKGEG